ncbi:MAG: FGGY-family carbohydrate kinase [Planctomycetaceae bacterium]|jgi:sugar (pentulose or hexulose) kinase|nr:FGGY-family carbohydrate kinase [Planctomycetaceae bacterium]
MESTSLPAVFIGIHLDAARVNVSAVSETGEILAESYSPFAPHNPINSRKHLEINPEIWWEATRVAIGNTVNKLRSKLSSPSQLKAISVCSNSGSLVVLDRAGVPAMSAILPEDARAVDQVKSLNYHGQEHCNRLGFQFKPDSPLAKIAWIKENLPELYENACFVHQADYVVGKLKGKADVTEYSLAMKTGCDLVEENWPDWLDYDMHLGVRDKLPHLVALGEKVGTVSQKASSDTGLPTGVAVVMGTTSQTASFLASGAKRTGDFSLILQKGMTVSGISQRIVIDPLEQMLVYKLPHSKWLFSVESKTGAEWVNVWFGQDSFRELESQVKELLPTTYIAYPNVTKGELFPFNTSSAEGFISPATDNKLAQFASCLQGTAMFERYCYQKLDRMASAPDGQSTISGVSSLGDIYSTGEWSASDMWMQCRADVTGRVNRRVVGQGGAAFGAAMIAARGVHYKSLETASDKMVSSEAVFFPNPELTSMYADLYTNFCTLMEEQGYLL